MTSAQSYRTKVPFPLDESWGEKEGQFYDLRISSAITKKGPKGPKADYSLPKGNLLFLGLPCQRLLRGRRRPCIGAQDTFLKGSFPSVERRLSPLARQSRSLSCLCAKPHFVVRPPN